MSQFARAYPDDWEDRMAEGHAVPPTEHHPLSYCLEHHQYYNSVHGVCPDCPRSNTT